MRFLSKLVIILTSAGLVALVFVYSLTQLLATPESLSAPLDKGGAYGLLAGTIKSQIADSLKAAQVSGPSVDSVLVQSVTADAVKAAIRPSLISITDWLKTEGSANAPDLAIDLTNIKARITTLARQQGDADVAFVATREIPDSLDPLKSDKGGNKNGSVGAISDNTEGSKTNPLIGFKEKYVMLVGLLVPLAGAVAGGLALLILFALRKPKFRFKSPGYAILLAGLITLGSIYIVPFVLGVTVLSTPVSSVGSTNMTILGTIKAALGATSIYAYTCIVIGVMLIFVGQFLVRDTEKNKKRKK